MHVRRKQLRCFLTVRTLVDRRVSDKHFATGYRRSKLRRIENTKRKISTETPPGSRVLTQNQSLDVPLKLRETANRFR